MVLGVTGLIGSGKSEVAAIFKKQGARLIDCDKIGREVVASDQEVLYRLVLEFGASILTKNRKLNRKALGRLAFASPERTAILNSIIHPALLAELDRRLEQARASRYNAVVDAALLIYWRYHLRMDCTILVSSHTRNRIRRLLKSGYSQDEIRQRTKSQLPLSYLRQESNIIIANNGDLATLRKRAKILYRQLTTGERG